MYTIILITALIFRSIIRTAPSPLQISRVRNARKEEADESPKQSDILTDYANALGDVDSRLDALETIGEIADSDIESLFA